jgi:hypothetical protein
MKKNKNTLSSQQRRYYRGVIVKKALEFYTKQPEAFVRDIMQAVKADWSPEFVHQFLKMRFNKGRSTGDLVLRPTEFLTAIWAHYRVNYNLDIPPPNEPPIEQLIQQEKDNG